MILFPLGPILGELERLENCWHHDCGINTFCCYETKQLLPNSTTGTIPGSQGTPIVDVIFQSLKYETISGVAVQKSRCLASIYIDKSRNRQYILRLDSKGLIRKKTVKSICCSKHKYVIQYIVMQQSTI